MIVFDTNAVEDNGLLVPKTNTPGISSGSRGEDDDFDIY